MVSAKNRKLLTVFTSSQKHFLPVRFLTVYFFLLVVISATFYQPMAG